MDLKLAWKVIICIHDVIFEKIKLTELIMYQIGIEGCETTVNLEANWLNSSVMSYWVLRQDVEDHLDSSSPEQCTPRHWGPWILEVLTLTQWKDCDLSKGEMRPEAIKFDGEASCWS